MSTDPQAPTDRESQVLALVDHYNRANAVGCPTSYLVEHLDIARQVVHRHLQALASKGWLRSSQPPLWIARALEGVTRDHLPQTDESAQDATMAARQDDRRKGLAPGFVEMAPLSLRAEVAAASADDEARTVELIWSTGAPVERYDWMSDKRYLETLSLEPSAVRLGRLNEGGPLLDAHGAYSVSDILGSVVPGSVTLAKNQARATVRFSRRDTVEPIWQDVRDGIIRSVSVGYRVYKFEETVGEKNAMPVRKAVDWEPFEVSMVPIPADSGAHVRGSKPADVNPCEIVTRSEPAVSAEQTKTAPEAQEDQAKPAETAEQERTMPEDQSRFIVEKEEKPERKAASVEITDSDRAVQRETERCEGIITACEQAKLPRSFAKELIKNKTTLLEARGLVLAEMAIRDGDDTYQPPNGSDDDKPQGRTEVLDDNRVHERAAIERSLCHRVDPDHFKLQDADRQYRGMSLMDCAELFLRAKGIRLTGMSKSERAGLALGLSQRGGAMHTTSDFPLLLADVSYKVLRAAYEAAPQTWRAIAQSISLADFKASNRLQVGEAPALLEVTEHGEFKAGTITEAREQVQLKTYGRKFAITRQALINDDTGAFGQVPGAFGRGAATLENTLAWAQITSNPTMGDSNALFDATNHGNYTASGTAISVDSLGVARKALRSQKGVDGLTTINVMGRFLMVPAAKETIADQYVTQITPAANSNASPFGPGGRTPLTVICEPILDAASATAWYMATDSLTVPVLLYATLDGQGGPMIEQRVGFDVDGLEIKCRHDVAFKAADWRGIYKNVGA